jgi:AhpC/TSA family
MIRWLSSLFAAFIFQLPASAQDPPAQRTPAPPVSAGKDQKDLATRLEALRKEVDDALAAYQKLKPSDPEDKTEAAWNRFAQTSDANGPKVIDLVRQDPTSDASFDALGWIVIEARNLTRPYGLQAVELLRDHHTKNPKIGRVCGALGVWWRWEKEPVLEFLRAAARQNPDRTARGNATLALARLMNMKAQTLEYQKKGDPKAAAREAEALFDEVVSKYADCPNLRTRPRSTNRFEGTIGDEAGAELFELRYLAVGKVPPDIEGEDLDGQKFKLSDYRGKVVVLDFWGHW